MIDYGGVGYVPKIATPIKMGGKGKWKARLEIAGMRLVEEDYAYKSGNPVRTMYVFCTGGNYKTTSFSFDGIYWMLKGCSNIEPITVDVEGEGEMVLKACIVT